MTQPATHTNGARGVGATAPPSGSSSTLGTQINALGTLFRKIQAFPIPSSLSQADSIELGLAKAAAEQLLFGIMVSLNTLDTSLVSYEAEVAQFYADSQTAITKANAAANAAQTDEANRVPAVTAIGIGVGGTVLGGILGAVATHYLSKKDKE